MISIHALREEGDAKPTEAGESVRHFYPRPPRGGRQITLCDFVVAFVISIHALREEGDCRGQRSGRKPLHFYPRPPRGGRRCRRAGRLRGDKISIHALREEGDTNRASKKCGVENFYPRPPRGGRRYTGGRLGDITVFLSTPSARRATRRRQRGHTHAEISIHALREEGDT